MLYAVIFALGLILGWGIRYVQECANHISKLRIR